MAASGTVTIAGTVTVAGPKFIREYGPARVVARSLGDKFCTRRRGLFWAICYDSTVLEAKKLTIPFISKDWSG